MHSEDQVVPNKRARTLFRYDPELVVINMAVDPDLDTYPETVLGKFAVLQTIDHNVQGYYLKGQFAPGILGEYLGYALVKHLGARNDIIRQFRDYSGVGVSADAATQIRLAEDKKNLEREIAFARKLAHENIVRILGFISPDGKPDSINAIIMEGNFNGPLEVYASRNQIPLPEVKAFALQLASALQYCHSRGIMHRDVRARNIYVQDENRIKLGNFGYARVGNKEENHTANKGEELYYRAPEMISRHTTTEYSFSVDVYGFALVLWSMLHGGRKPYNDDPACEKLMKNETKFKQHLVEGKRPGIEDNVDQGLANLIKKCWINETEIDKRPSMVSVIQTLQNM